MQVTALTEAQRETFVRATASVYDRAANLVGEGELAAMRRAAAAASAGLPSNDGWS
jgi:hypothetical protein